MEVSDMFGSDNLFGYPIKIYQGIYKIFLNISGKILDIPCLVAYGKDANISV